MDILLCGLVLAAIVFFLGLMCLYIDFLTWIVSGERNFDKPRRISDQLLIVAAVLGIAYCYPDSKNSARDWPVSLPADWLSVFLLVLGCLPAYLYSTIRTRLGPALLEMAVNFLLFIALLSTTMTGLQVGDPRCWIICIVPLYMMLIMALAGNYRRAREGMRGAEDPH